MKTDHAPARRAAWLYLAAPALLATPAFAQETTPPPPVVPTVNQSQSTAPSGESGRPSTASTVDPASKTRIAPGAEDVVDEARIAARAERAPARATPARTTRPAATVARSAPVAATAPAATTAAATPAQTTTPAPESAAPTAETTAPAPETTAPAADTSTATETTTTEQQQNGAPLWPIFALIALAVVGGAAYLLMRRRRVADEDEVYYEPETTYAAEPVTDTVHAEPVVEERPVVVERAPVHSPVAAAAPIAAAAATPALARVDATGSPAEPVAAPSEEVTVTDAEAEDVAALTDGAAPVRDRPWLEFAMRPVRAGTNADEALVEIELTVANSGNVAADNVRVSTFMLTDTHASEMENMLVDSPADAAVEPVTIAPGEGARIDATLAALKADLGGEGRFTPVVVADARYTLPDGSEGRTSASFVVGVADGEGGALVPIDLADRVMRDDIEARLHGAVEHA